MTKPLPTKHITTTRSEKIRQRHAPYIRDINLLQVLVSDHFNMTVIDLISHRRGDAVIEARFSCYWLCRHMIKAPYAVIGAQFNRPDHASVMHACKRVDRLRAEFPALAKAHDEIWAEFEITKEKK